MSKNGERELIVLRHAKSAWDTDAPSDFERPLAKRGKRDAPRMGEWMKARGLVPDFVVCSPARRARQTARRALEAMDDMPVEIRWEEELYGAGLRTLLAVLAGVPGASRRVMIVGHNPGLESLVLYLAGDDFPFGEEKKIFPTAALAHFVMPEDWTILDHGSGELMATMRPKRL